jgi:hypothetical protein
VCVCVCILLTILFFLNFRSLRAPAEVVSCCDCFARLFHIPVAYRFTMFFLLTASLSKTVRPVSQVLPAFLLIVSLSNTFQSFFLLFLFRTLSSLPSYFLLTVSLSKTLCFFSEVFPAKCNEPNEEEAVKKADQTRNNTETVCMCVCVCACVCVCVCVVEVWGRCVCALFT